MTLRQGKWVDLAEISYLTVHQYWLKQGIGGNQLKAAEHWDQ